MQKNEFNLDKEELEKFLLNYSGKLIKGTVDYVEEVKQFITSAPDSKDVDALSKLVGASASAIESLNKILLQDKANEAKIQVKQMDIESKKELQQETQKSLGLTINREELLKQLLDEAKVIDADVEKD
jgi:alkyl sulfatase BDS1-like metallo-beta-lactamase superfamily hydrolase